MPLDSINLDHLYFVLWEPQNGEDPLVNIISSYPGARRIKRAHHFIVAFCHNYTKYFTAPTPTQGQAGAHELHYTTLLSLSIGRLSNPLQPLCSVARSRLDSNQCNLFPKSNTITHERARLPSGAAYSPPFATSPHGSRASKPHLGKLTTFNSCFNFKLSERIGVFG